MRKSIDESLRNHFYHKPEMAAMLKEKEQEVLNNKKTPFSAARELLDFYYNS